MVDNNRGKTVENMVKVVKDKMRDVEMNIKETVDEGRRREDRINKIIVTRR